MRKFRSQMQPWSIIPAKYASVQPVLDADYEVFVGSITRGLLFIIHWKKWFTLKKNPGIFSSSFAITLYCLLNNLHWIHTLYIIWAYLYLVLFTELSALNTYIVHYLSILRPCTLFSKKYRVLVCSGNVQCKYSMQIIQ